MSSEKPTADPASNVVNNASPIARSLVISPNLDALLEYEDRTRGQTTGFSEPKTPESSSQPRLWRHSTAVPSSAEFPIGLPPPPRRFRSLRLPSETRTNPLLPELVEEESRENQENITAIPISPLITSTTSNPYINPAPTLDRVRHVGMLSVSGRRGVATDNKIEEQLDRNHDNFADCALQWSQIDALPTQRSLHELTTQNSDGGQQLLGEEPVSALPTRSRGKLAKHSLPAKKPGQ